MTDYLLPLGMFSWFGYELPIQERLQLIREAGFTTTSLWWDDRDELADLRKDDFPSLVRDCGLILEYIHVPYDGCNAFWSEEPPVRRQVIDEHLRWIDDCRRLQIPVLVMHVTQGSTPPPPHQAALADFATLVEAAESAQIVLAIENTRREEYLGLLFEAYQTPHLGLCYDSSHDWLYGAEKARLLRQYDGRVVTTHLSDNDGAADRHWLPGHGIVDWELIVSSFPRNHYPGSLFLEVFPMEDEQHLSPRDFVQAAFSTGERLLRAVESLPPRINLNS